MADNTLNTLEKDPVEKLQSVLDKDFSWRKRELTIAKNNIDSAIGEELNFALKVATITLYSHWEGFIKNASIKYLEFLNKKKYKIAQLKTNFKILHYTKDFLEVSGSRKKKKYAELYEIFSRENQEVFCVNLKSNEIINTYGNLKFENLEEILFSLNLDVSDFETKNQIIDTKLLAIRNKIAHGQEHRYISKSTPLEIDTSIKYDFFNVYNDIINLMDKFKDLIINSALNETYLSSNINDEISQ